MVTHLCSVTSFVCTPYMCWIPLVVYVPQGSLVFESVGVVELTHLLRIPDCLALRVISFVYFSSELHPVLGTMNIPV